MTSIPGNGPHRRSALRRATAMTWLVLISGLVVIDHVALSRVAELAETSASDIRVAVLEARLDGLTRLREEELQQPAVLSEARYEDGRRALEQRLTMIEQAFADRSMAEQLSSLQARIERLEARRQAAARPATPPSARPRPAAAPRPKVTKPPFEVIGVELRAGERFLSILRSGANALSNVRLLRTREMEADWQLEAIEETSAVFRHGGQTHRLTVPQR